MQGVGCRAQGSEFKLLRRRRQRRGPKYESIQIRRDYRGTSLIRKRTPLGPYHRHVPRVLRGS